MSAWPMVVRELPDFPEAERRGASDAVLRSVRAVVNRFWADDHAECHFLPVKDAYVVRVICHSGATDFEGHVMRTIQSHVPRPLKALYAAPALFYSYIIFRDYDRPDDPAVAKLRDWK